MEYAIGQIYLFAGNFAPRNWMICDGTLLSIAQHQSLYSILGNTYGGDGRTTFALPDFRGRAPVHKNTSSAPDISPISLGEKGGQEDVSLLTKNLPSHTHTLSPTLNYRNEIGDESNPGGGSFALSTQNIYHTDAPSDMEFLNSGVVSPATEDTGSGKSFSNRQPYVGLNYIICVVGLFPNRN